MPKSPEPRDQSESRQKRQGRILWIIVSSVLVLHIIGGIVFGSIVIFRHFSKNEVLFEPVSEVARTLDARKITHEIKIQKRLNQSGRPPVANRIQADRASDFSLPDVTVKNPLVTASLQRTPVQNFSLSGSGTGLGTGGGSGSGSGIGSDVSFFGVKSQAERIAIVVDASVSMIEDERGGLPGYKAVKDELDIIFRSLQPGTFLSFFVFASEVVQLADQPRLVSDELVAGASDLIRPVLTLTQPNDPKSLVKLSGRSGQSVYEGGGELIPIRRGPTRLDRAILAALEQTPQIIFILSDGQPIVVADLNAEEQAELDKRREAIIKSRGKRSSSEERAVKERQEAYKKDQAENAAKRSRKGLPPKFLETGGGGGGGEGLPGPPMVSGSQLLEEIVAAAKKIYGDANLPLPKIYTVGYACNDQEERFMRDLSIAFQGRYRSLKRLVPPIRDR